MYTNYDKEDRFGVVGIGVDIVSLKRFSEMTPSVFKRLSERVLCEGELAEFEKDGNKPQRLAVLFSSKESVAKALGCGFVGISFKDIMILNNEKNRPTVWLSEKAAVLADSLNIKTVKLSVSHEKEYVVTQAIAF